MCNPSIDRRRYIDTRIHSETFRLSNSRWRNSKSIVFFAEFYTFLAWGMWKDDIESASRPLYPMMLESPELRWSFIRKIYGIVSIQLLLTIAVASVVVTVHPISHFFATTRVGLGIYIVLIIAPFVGIISLPCILVC